MAPKPTTAERIRSLRKVPKVALWFNDHGVSATAETQLVNLEILLRRMGLESGQALLDLAADVDALRARVQQFLAKQLKDGYSQKYSFNLWYAARSFLAFHDRAPEWNPQPKKVSDEDDEEEDRASIPTYDQMRQIAAAWGPRARAAGLLILSSGIRVGVLGSQFEPIDGLRLRHLPELVLDGAGAPKFRRAKSFTIRVPKHLSKTSREYVTFGSPDAADALLAYLRGRATAGEHLGPTSPVIAADPRGHALERKSKDGTVFVSRKSLAFTIAEPMRRVAPKGVHWHTYLLRKWFSVQMESCEARGLITKTRREMLMGHRSVDTTYNLETSAGVEKLRESYEACVPYLSLSETDRKQLDARAELLGSLLKAIEEGTGKRADGPITGETLKEILRDALGASLTGDSPSGLPPAVGIPRASRPGEQRAVPSEAVGTFLSAGWSFVSPLNSHLAVVEWTGPVNLGPGARPLEPPA